MRDLDRVMSDISSSSQWPDFLATFYYPKRKFSWKSDFTSRKKKRRNRKKLHKRRLNRKNRRNLIQKEQYRWFKSRAPAFQMKNRLKSFQNHVESSGPRLAQLKAPQTTTPEPSVVEHLSQATQAGQRRPNVILMMADDQDVELGSLQFMPKLNRFLKSGGAHMENG